MKRSAAIVANPNVSKKLLPELWLAILSYLTLYQRCQLMTVCTAWGTTRQGFIPQSIISLKKRDPVPFDPSSLVNLKHLQTYWNHGIMGAIKNGCFNQLRHLEVLKSAKRFKPYECNDIGLLTNLTSLRIDCDNNDYFTILTQLTNLKQLQLNQYHAFEYESEITLLSTISALTDLTVSFHSVRDTTLLGCTNLKTLTLDNNYSISPCTISQLTQLTSLNLLKDSKRDYEGMLLCLTNLTSLGLESNDKMKDEHITHLSSLRSLSVSNQEYLTSDCLNYFPHLTKLVINNWKFETTNLDDQYLNKNLLTLTQLKELKFHGSAVLKSETLEKLTNLTSLSINPNSNIIKPSFTTLTNLTKLKLCHSSLIQVDISYLPSSLRILNLGQSYKWYHLMQFMPKYLPNLVELTLGITGGITKLCVCFSKMMYFPKLERLFYAHHDKLDYDLLFYRHLQQVPAHVQTLKYS